ncbi:MAG: hypothetical protein IJ644_08125 [Oscillospiraceae bacterium]|nr:hypothetical protein [Oscillospiraceae bacterium]
MNFKKMTAALTAIAACMSACIPAAAFAEDAAEASTDSVSAYLSFVDGGWWPKFQNGEEDSLKQEFTEITGDGTYTVTVSAEDLGADAIAESVSGVEFMAVIVNDAYEKYPNMAITIDSIKTDDKEIALTAKNYTSSDDEVEMRANIYNPWVSKLPADAHTAEGKLSDMSDTSDYSYKIINPEDFAGWTTLSVEFTVSGMEAETPTETEAETETEEVTETSAEETTEAAAEKIVVGQSYLNFVDGGWWPKFQNGDDDSLQQTFTEITGNGSYTVKVTAADLDENAIAEGISGVEFMAVIVNDAYEKYPEMVLTIDSIVADDKEIPLIAKNYTSSDDEKEVRTNIYNPWVSKLPADAHSTEGVLSELADSSDYSYKIINPEDFAGWKTLSVNFTVSGLAFDKFVEETPEETEASTESESTTTTTTSTTKSTTATTKATTTTAKTTSGSTESPKTGDVNIPAVAGAVAAAAVASLLVTKKKND